ncbi:zinc metalloprotease HtpX [Candidatus Pacearchaeota archaeon]|nr:MAG: zinc metalloprotease HtpX [Candidatus Pacearchaeota archaeon]
MQSRLSFHDEIRKNKVKSAALIVVIVGIFALFGWLLSAVLGQGTFFVIMSIAIVVSILYVVASYYNAEKIAIASVGAKPASRAKHKKLFDVVENISIASGLPMPKLYVMESSQINAFASGRDPEHAVICVTTGALEKLDKRELEGVVAHEMAHIANYDVRFMTLAAVLVGLIAIAAEMFLRSLWFSSFGGERREGRGGAALFFIAILAAILAPLLANLVSLAISRKREFAADATGVKFTRYPVGLRNALIKIQREQLSPTEMRRYPRALAPLFISNPFKSKIRGLFSTHPPLEERIKRLERM